MCQRYTPLKFLSNHLGNRLKIGHFIGWDSFVWQLVSQIYLMRFSMRHVCSNACAGISVLLLDNCIIL